MRRKMLPLLVLAALAAAAVPATEANLVEGVWLGKSGCQTSNAKTGDSPLLEHDGRTERYAFWRFDPQSPEPPLRSPVSCPVPELQETLLHDEFTFYSYLRPRGTTRQRLVLVSNEGDLDLILSLDPKDDATYTFRAQYSPSNVQTCDVPADLVPLDEWVYLVKSCRLTKTGTVRCTLFVSGTVVCSRDYARDFAVAKRIQVGSFRAVGAGALDIAFSSWEAGKFDLLVPTPSPTTSAPTGLATGDDGDDGDDDGGGGDDDDTVAIGDDGQGSVGGNMTGPGGNPDEAPPAGGDMPESPEVVELSDPSTTPTVLGALAGAFAVFLVVFALVATRRWSRTKDSGKGANSVVGSPGPRPRSTSSTAPAQESPQTSGDTPSFVLQRLAFQRLPIFSRIILRPVSAPTRTIDV